MATSKTTVADLEATLQAVLQRLEVMEGQLERIQASHQFLQGQVDKLWYK